MMRKKGEWTIKETAQKFECEFFEVIQDQVIKPDGSDGSYETIKMKPGVNVLPIDENGNVYLTTQYRYALEDDCLEVIAGGIETGETPIQSAKKEAHEELGIEAEEWTEFGVLNVDTSIVNSQAHQFLARKLKFKEPEQEGSENIKAVKVTLQEAVEKVLRGEITHAPSAALILKAHVFLQKDNAKSV
jgi:8-oxo-dGTP pyrophosphatase MutT (NUDIX family)